MTPLGQCQHCGVTIYDTPGDPRLAGMAERCWKCCKPHGITMNPR